MSVRKFVARAVTVAATAAVLAAPATVAHASNIESVETVHTDGAEGPVYRVVPSPEGRSQGSSALSSDPSADMKEAGVPASPGLVNQFICHAIFAATKETWNLESDRPDVGLSATISSRCNPK